MLTPDAYIEQIKEPRRSEIRALHAMIQKAVPKLVPSIQSGMIGYGTYHYKYASGREGNAPIIGLSSRANYISVYLCGSENGERVGEELRAELAKADCGKGCIRFKKLADIDLKVLEKLVKLGAKTMAKAASGAAQRERAQA